MPLKIMWKMKKKTGKLNNKGVTLVELIVSFTLLAIFMVAAMRVISYTVNIYHAAKGATYGLEVANMISNKIVGQIEGATAAKVPVVTTLPDGNDAISFVDKTGSAVTVCTTNVVVNGNSKKYMNIHYDEVTEGSVKYDAVDWQFDSKAYMGYTVKKLSFEDVGENYADNVTRMTLELYSDRYGDYTSVYFIKCSNVSEITYE